MARPKPPPLAYEPRCLIFVDVLGWSNLVCESARAVEQRQKIAEIYERLFKTARFIQGVEATDHAKEVGWAATLLSDSLALSCPPGQTAALLDHVAADFAFLLTRLAVCVRGAIVLGDLYHRANVIIGPALVRAVRLEKATCYPRVVVDGSARDIVPGEMTFVDSDDNCTFDYFTHAVQNTGQLVTTLAKAREVIEANLVKHANDGEVVAKYRWLQQYLAALEGRRASGTSAGRS